MSFNCTANRQGTLQYQVRHANGVCGVMVPIGFAIPDRTYYFVVQAYPIYGTIEFVFGIIEQNNATKLNRKIFDLKQAGLYISDEDKEHVTIILHHYTNIIVRTLHPAGFFMETYMPYLPTKALAKYVPLCDIFSASGYTVTKAASDTPGKHKWVMN